MNCHHLKGDDGTKMVHIDLQKSKWEAMRSNRKQSEAIGSKINYKKSLIYHENGTNNGHRRFLPNGYFDVNTPISMAHKCRDNAYWV